MASRFTVDDLIDLAAPPERRVDAGSRDQWTGVEKALGNVLPDDYKLIINAYCFLADGGEFGRMASDLDPARA
jgi:hypothetical protein